MQTATYNIIDKTPVILWRALPVQLTITGINDISGDWVFLLDKDWVDGAIITGEITKDNNNIIVTIDLLDNNYIATAISGKPLLECFGTLTDNVNQCFLIPINIQNRTVNTAPAPTPATSYYTKAQTDTLLAEKADESALSDYLLKTGGTISSLILSNSSDTPLFSFQDGTANNGLLFSQSYVNSNITISTTLFRVRNSTVTISAAGGLNLQSSINEINYNNHAKNTAGGLCVLDVNGSLAIPGNITTNGKENITLNSLSIVPKENKIYKYTLSADSELTIDTTALTASNTVDFELHLVQGATAKAVTWPNSIVWGENGVFKGSNTAPAINEANTLYAFSIRWNGSILLVNLAYSQEITA